MLNPSVYSSALRGGCCVPPCVANVITVIIARDVCNCINENYYYYYYELYKILYVETTFNVDLQHGDSPSFCLGSVLRLNIVLERSLRPRVTAVLVNNVIFVS